MPRHLPLLILLVAVGCGPRVYRQPTETEPHAILKLRHIVHAKLGPNYGATTLLGGHAIDERTLEGDQSDASTWHLRVRPEAAAFQVAGHSFHFEQRQVQRSRSVPESYMCSRQQCSYFNGRSQCQSVMSTCTRNRTEYYWTTQTVSVDDDACARALMLAPSVGHTYLIQFDYLGSGDCQAQCFEQVVAPDGTFALSPCPIPPPPAVSAR